VRIRSTSGPRAAKTLLYVPWNAPVCPWHRLTAEQEGRKGFIKLKAIGEGDDDDSAASDDPEAIKLMVDFFYTLDYKAEPLDQLQPSSTEELMNVDSELGMPVESAFDRTWGSSGWANSSPLGSPVIERKSYKMKKKSTNKAVAAPATANDNVVMHAKVFAVAVKYQIKALQSIAAAKFTDAAGTSWYHTAFAEAARIAYITTPDVVRDLRDVVCNTIHIHVTLLNKQSIENVLKDIPDLHFEVLRLARGLPAVAQRKVIDDGLRCAECSSWLSYKECRQCATEYRACCNKCTNPSCGANDSD
jgi:hypothetical protein